MLTTDYEYAFFSNLVYYTAEEQSRMLESLEGWQCCYFEELPFKISINVAKGFAAYAFIHNLRKQVVIAFRGTVLPSMDKITASALFTSLGNLYTDLRGIAANLITNEQIAAVKFVKDVFEKLNEEKYNIGTFSNEGYEASLSQSHYQLSFTGHSLGAWLAEITAVSYKVHAVTFESPGSLPMLKQLARSNIKGLRSDNICVRYPKILTYLTAPNLINTCNPHGGEVRQVYLEQHDKDFYSVVTENQHSKFNADQLKDWFLYTFNQHSMEAILKTFNPDIGLPTIHTVVFDWPRIEWLRVFDLSPSMIPLSIITNLLNGLSIFEQYLTFHRYKGAAVLKSNSVVPSEHELYCLRHVAKYDVQEFDPTEITFGRIPPEAQRALLLYKKYGVTKKVKQVQQILPLSENELYCLKHYEIKCHKEFLKMPVTIILPENRFGITAYAFRTIITKLFATYPELLSILEQERANKYLNKELQEQEHAHLTTELVAAKNKLEELEDKLKALSIDGPGCSVETRMRNERERLLLLVDAQKLKLQTHYQRLAVIKSISDPDTEFAVRDRYIHIKLIRENGLQNNPIFAKERLSSPMLLAREEETVRESLDNEVGLETLFEFNKNGKKIRRVLISGKAGIGKTTLCQYVADRWSRHLLWNKEFDWVFWISLRRLSNYSLMDLRKMGLQEIVERECFLYTGIKGSEYALLWSEILRNEWPVLLILDGLDEMAPDAANVLLELLARLPQGFSILMTSRPQPVNIRFDLRLETAGFTSKDINNYTNRYFNDNLQDSMALKGNLDCNPALLDMAHIPINLELICLLWEKKIIKGQERHISMTGLYRLIVKYFFEKAVVYQGISDKKTRVEDTLSRLAFYGAESKQIVFSKEDITRCLPANINIEDLKRTGLLRSMNGSAVLASQDYSFLHLTFQEYFVAQYLVQNFKREYADVVQFIQSSKFEPQFTMICQFIAGLLNRKRSEYTHEFLTILLSGMPHDLIGFQHLLLLLPCLDEMAVSTHEAEDNPMQIWRSQVVERVVLWTQVVFGLWPMNPKEGIALGYAIPSLHEELLRALKISSSLFKEAQVKELFLSCLKSGDAVIRERIAGLLSHLGAHGDRRITGCLIRNLKHYINSKTEEPKYIIAALEKSVTQTNQLPNEDEVIAVLMKGVNEIADERLGQYCLQALVKIAESRVSSDSSYSEKFLSYFLKILQPGSSSKSVQRMDGETLHCIAVDGLSCLRSLLSEVQKEELLIMYRRYKDDENGKVAGKLRDVLIDSKIINLDDEKSQDDVLEDLFHNNSNIKEYNLVIQQQNDEEMMRGQVERLVSTDKNGNLLKRLLSKATSENEFSRKVAQGALLELSLQHDKPYAVGLMEQITEGTAYKSVSIEILSQLDLNLSQNELVYSLFLKLIEQMKELPLELIDHKVVNSIFGAWSRLVRPSNDVITSCIASVQKWSQCNLQLQNTMMVLLSHTSLVGYLQDISYESMSANFWTRALSGTTLVELLNLCKETKNFAYLPFICHKALVLRAPLLLEGSRDQSVFITTYEKDEKFSFIFPKEEQGQDFILGMKAALGIVTGVEWPKEWNNLVSMDHEEVEPLHAEENQSQSFCMLL